MTQRSIFVADQLEAAWTATEQDLSNRAHDASTTELHGAPFETAIAGLLAAQIQTLPLCEHVSHTTPGRLQWSPGMAVLGCPVDYHAHRRTLTLNRCDCCGDAVPVHRGLAVLAVGPVLVFTTVCPTCLDSPTTASTWDYAAAIAHVLQHLVARWDGTHRGPRP